MDLSLPRGAGENRHPVFLDGSNKGSPGSIHQHIRIVSILPAWPRRRNMGRSAFANNGNGTPALPATLRPSRLGRAGGGGCTINGPGLARFVDQLILDFWHAAGYLGGAAAGVAATRSGRAPWFEGSRHRLKEEPGGASALLKEMKRALRRRPQGRGRPQGTGSGHLLLYQSSRQDGLQPLPGQPFADRIRSD
jgi:hypothetical protein